MLVMRSTLEEIGVRRLVVIFHSHVHITENVWVCVIMTAQEA